MTSQGMASSVQPAGSTAAQAGEASASSSTVPGGDEGGTSSLGDDALLEVLRERAVAAVGQLRESMRGASLVTLAPGELTLIKSGKLHIWPMLVPTISV